MSSLMKRRKQKCLIILGVCLLYYFGVFTMMMQSSIDEFEYPLNEPVAAYVKYWIDSKFPIRDPINFYNHSFIHPASDKCSVDAESRLRLVFLVKSAVPNFDRREAIRKSWGFERRFSDVELRTVFMLGAVDDPDIQKQINEENKRTGDIVQASFKDTYYNNTIKTMMAITWAVKYCSHAKFYFFSDDDMYVSTKNALRFVRNPLNYPQYLEEYFKLFIENKTKQAKSQKNSSVLDRGRKQFVDIDIPDDAELYAGFVFRTSRPHRHQPSKWYLPLSEYPYNFFPPYVTAGSFVLTNTVLHKFYYASFYTKHFRFDDIYLAILAKKLDVVPVHNSEFYFDKKPYNVLEYRYVVASHGYSDPKELEQIWAEQRSAGNA